MRRAPTRHTDLAALLAAIVAAAKEPREGDENDMAEIKVQAFSIERIEFPADEDEYRQAREAEELGDAYDVFLSDMDGETVIFDPDGHVINPYGGTEQLMELLRPILAHVPAWQVVQYATERATVDR